MKITILIGWPETTPRGTPAGKPETLSVVDCDSQERRTQFGIFDSAKRLHRYPAGIKCMAMAICEDPVLAIAIGDHSDARSALPPKPAVKTRK